MVLPWAAHRSAQLTKSIQSGSDTAQNAVGIAQMLGEKALRAVASKNGFDIKRPEEVGCEPYGAGEEQVVAASADKGELSLTKQQALKIPYRGSQEDRGDSILFFLQATQ